MLRYQIVALDHGILISCGRSKYLNWNEEEDEKSQSVVYFTLNWSILVVFSFHFIPRMDLVF